MRLNRFLAAAGLGSRRSCDELIASGSVFLNGQRVEKLATQVAPDDDVRVHGRVIHVARPVYLLFNKITLPDCSMDIDLLVIFMCVILK